MVEEEGEPTLLKNGSCGLKWCAKVQDEVVEKILNKNSQLILFYCAGGEVQNRSLPKR